MKPSRSALGLGIHRLLDVGSGELEEVLPSRSSIQGIQGQSWSWKTTWNTVDRVALCPGATLSP